MKELNIMSIINNEEEKNNENEKYNNLNNDDLLITNDTKENNTPDFSNDIKVKDCNYYKNCLKSFFINKSFIAFFFIYFLYILSLEGCYEGEDECSIKKKWIYSKIIEGIASCIILIIVFQLILFKYLSKFHLIHLVIIFLLLYIYSHGLEFPDHGYFNFLFYFIIFIISTIIIQPISIFIYCIQKYNINMIILLIYIDILLIVFGSGYNNFILKLKTNCVDWGKGLNNTFIENDRQKHGCHLHHPTRCADKFFKYFQDYTKMSNKDCKTYKVSNSRKEILKYSSSPYINNDAKRIGFPLTNKDPICFEDFGYEENIIYNYIFRNLVDMDNDEILNKYFKEKKPEIEIDFTDNEQGKMIINVEYNQTLSNERKLLEKNSNPITDNILFIFIDSVSRVNSIRQLNKTMSFFEKFISYKGSFSQKYPSENYHSFQFFKYHAFLGYTQGNYPLIFYARDKKDPKKVLLTKYLKELGYITSNAHDVCKIDNTRSYHNFTKEEVYDHQFIICDPNNEDFSQTTIRCLYGKQNIEPLFEYTNQFWRKYKDNRKYSVLVANNGHEGTLSVVKYSDDIIYNFLNNLFEDNLLKDTTVILLSDHGTGMPSIYYAFNFYKIEIHLPMLYIIINDKKNKSYEEQYKFINENQQTLVTGFDIYNTIGHLAFGEKYFLIKNKTKLIDTPKSEFGKSLFEKINSKERNPTIYSNFSTTFNIYEGICTKY